MSTSIQPDAAVVPRLRRRMGGVRRLPGGAVAPATDLVDRRHGAGGTGQTDDARARHRAVRAGGPDSASSRRCGSGSAGRSWSAIVAAFLAYARTLYLDYGNTFGVLSGGDSKLPARRCSLAPATWIELARYSVVWGVGVRGGASRDLPGVAAPSGAHPSGAGDRRAGPRGPRASLHVRLVRHALSPAPRGARRLAGGGGDCTGDVRALGDRPRAGRARDGRSRPASRRSADPSPRLCSARGWRSWHRRARW